jgi:hypothetical protein
MQFVAKIKKTKALQSAWGLSITNSKPLKTSYYSRELEDGSGKKRSTKQLVIPDVEKRRSGICVSGCLPSEGRRVAGWVRRFEIAV